MNKEEKEKLVKEMLEQYGEDTEREGLVDTPRRVREMLENTLLCGYDQNPEEYLEVTFDSDSNEMVVVENIDFYSMCEHHMLPFYGKAHIGYIPSDRVVGISKLPRTVDAYARRLQQQERLTTQVADAINKYLKPEGVIVYLEGIHMCMRMRGVKKQNATMKTSAVRGKFRNDRELEQKFLTMVKD